jgi:Bacterial SH3 domain
MKTAFLLAFLPLVALAEPASVVRSSPLMSEPATDATKIADLPANAAVDARERRGGWIQVRTAAGQEGWVKLLALRYAANAKAGDSGLSQAINVARTGSSGTQVTTGVRGLDDEKIATAQPNAAELKKLEGFSVPAVASAQFAQRGKLQAQTVSYPK